MNSTLTKIGVRGLVIASVGVLAVSAAYVRGGSPGYTFATQGVQLLIDSKAWYNGSPVPGATWSLKNLVPGADHFFNFPDIKPGDRGCNVISVHVNQGNAWMCLDFKNLKQYENGINEPESLLDSSTSTGELAQGTEFFGWSDNGDGIYDPVHEKMIFGTSTRAATYVLNDKSYVIGDSQSGGMCKQHTTRYVGICWCAGKMIIDPQTGSYTCDASTIGNAAQTDSFTVDVQIRAEQADLKPGYICGSKPPKDGGENDNEHEHSSDDSHSNNIIIKNDDKGSITSTTDSSSNTGGNSGGSIKTGSSTSLSKSQIIINAPKVIKLH